MCSILGFNWNDVSLIKKMNEVLKHRGPNNQNIYTDSNVSLAHNRLSIIDLSVKANQPMSYQHNNESVVIVYNGEVYNFLELKKNLIEKGYKFDSESDTEVILAMYIEHGFDCVKYFNGMWAFCIYDISKRLLFCSRDRFGQKPFYYYYNNDKFIFASEIKALINYAELEINQAENILSKSIDFYLDLGFIPSPYTIYKNINKICSSENLIFNLKENSIKKWTYFSLGKYNPINDESYLIKKMQKLIMNSIQLRMISDVHIGTFLSGGLDSSYITALMQKFTSLSDLHTFSIGFEGEYDESKYIDIVKDYYGTKHHHYMFYEKDLRNLLNTYSHHYDEPFGDFAGFPTFAVSEIAKKYVTVVLSGDGGDEIFGGSSNLHKGRRLDIIQKIPTSLKKTILFLSSNKWLTNNNSINLLRDALKITLRNKYEFPLEQLNLYNEKSDNYKIWFRNNIEFSLKLANDKFSEAFRINDILFNTFGDNFLLKVDRASMASSIEVRSPYLDYRIVDLSMRIPFKWKHGLTKNKLLMKKMIKDYLPKEIVNREKQGFTPPLQEWIDKEFYNEIINQYSNSLKSLNNSNLNYHLEKNSKNSATKQMKIRLFLLTHWFNYWILNKK